MKRLILIAFYCLLFSVAAMAQSEETVQIKKSTAEECARAFEREKSLESALNAAIEARKADAQIIGTLKEIVELSRAETKELRGAVTELIKNQRPKDRCFLFCVRFR